MDLHLVKNGDGYAIVHRREGPYSQSDPIEDLVLDLTLSDLHQIGADASALNVPPPAPEPAKEGA